MPPLKLMRTLHVPLGMGPKATKKVGLGASPQIRHFVPRSCVSFARAICWPSMTPDSGIQT
jgi:hypothetical protein